MYISIHTLAQYFVDAPLEQLQLLVFLHMMPEAWLTHLWTVLPIPLQHLSQAPLGLKRSMGAEPFLYLSRNVQSDLNLGHSQTIIVALQPLLDILAVYSGLLSCWKMKCRSSLRSGVFWSRFANKMSLHIATFIFPSILTSLPVPPCCNTAKSSIFVLSDQQILFLMPGCHVPFTNKWFPSYQTSLMVVLLKGSPLSTEELWSSDSLACGFLVT